jgi:hypothetical protein
LTTDVDIGFALVWIVVAAVIVCRRADGWFLLCCSSRSCSSLRGRR